MVIQTTKTILKGVLGLTSKALSLGLDTTKYLIGVMSNDTEGIEVVEKNNPYDSKLIVDTRDYNYVVSKLRSFFKSKGFLEAHPQNRLSILAACEDPWTVASFDYAGSVWPLPQTGQMWLEYELLKNPEAPGYFCQSTSYRQEPNPTEGRHDLIFPLFEFEMHGGMDDLIEMEKELLTYLGYDFRKFVSGTYLDIAKEYGTEELEHEHEQLLYDEKSPTFFLTDFPEHTSPFWNMRRNTQTKLANKIDVIMSGQETIGSAEREVDVDVMKHRFETISEGGYKEKLYELFGKARTDEELKDYFKFNFIKRSGGGIGVTRLIRSMKMEGLIPENHGKCAFA
jgi:aspartyl/asparaginyl-tRNA synthetase